MFDTVYKSATIRCDKNRGIENIMFKIKSAHETETKSSVGGILDSYGVFELCCPTTLQPPCFALKVNNKPLVYVKDVEHKNAKVLYKPVKIVPWNLPTELEKAENEQALWKEIRDCIWEHADLPNENDYDILVAWVLATWLQEKWQSFPFLNFFGNMECGKSRCNEVLGKLAFRGWNATFVSPASLYRVCDQWHPTLLLDETEPMLKNPEMIALLNASYRKGSTVPRQTPQEDGSFKTEFFELHGFRVLSGTKELPQTLRSRSIVFHMRRAVRRVKMFIDEQRCTTIRNKLLAYRFDKMLQLEGEGCEGANPKVGLGELEGFAEQLGSGRLAEIFYCLWKVAPTQELKVKIIEYAKNLDKERSEELASSDDSLCLTAILRAINQGKMAHGLILLNDIAEEVNRNQSYNEQWTNRKIGSLCARLGFKKQSNRQKLTCIKWDEKLIEALKKDPRYAICFQAEEQAPPTPQTSPSPPSPPASPSSDWLQDSKEIQT